MQRLTLLRSRSHLPVSLIILMVFSSSYLVDAGRLQRAVDLYSRHSTQQVVWNINQWTSKRCLSSASKKNNDKKETDTHADLYRPSTAKTETHVPDDLKGGQAIETVAKPPSAKLTGGGKVWYVERSYSADLLHWFQVGSKPWFSACRAPRRSDDDIRSHLHRARTAAS